MAETTATMGFCEACRTGSTDDSPGNISTVNGIGRKFYGGAEKCGTCGAVVRVLWFTFFYIPLIPLGAYRFQQTEGGALAMRSRFLARRTPLRWSQVFTHWAVGLLLGVVFFAVVIAWGQSKRHR